MCIGPTESQVASLLLACSKAASFKFYAVNKFINVFSLPVIFYTYFAYICVTKTTNKKTPKKQKQKPKPTTIKKQTNKPPQNPVAKQHLSNNIIYFAF